jgi:Cu(I)/Ag(I) efflux system protein CusF
MRPYKVIILVNLAVGVGFLLGALWWGQEVRRLRRELAALQQETVGRSSTPGTWSAQGIVRVVAPEINRIFIDHADIPGLMEAMTMAFEPEDPRLLNGLSSGDRVRFSLRQKGDRLILVGVEKSGSP